MKRYMLVFCCMFTASVAANNQEVKKNDLQQIMNQLMNDSQSLNKAILLQDFVQIEKAAANIADHPKPSKKTLQAIKRQLAKEMPLFKSYDSAVHQAASEMVNLAKSKDIQLITVKYLGMYQGCQSCHIEFKERVSSALNEK